MSGGVAKRAEAPQVLQHVAPATLTLENMIDLGRERLALDAEETVASERLEPEPTPSASTPSAHRMVGARLGVRAGRHAADGRRWRHRSTVARPGNGSRLMPTS